GRVGLEAGLWGTPAVAFNVGGISEWLQEGFNGHFAAADPSSAAGLAAAITRSLEDGAHYAALRAGAFQAATRQSAEDHATRLAAVLDKVARAGSAGSTPDPQRPRAGRDEGTGRPLTAKERVVKPARLCFVVESGTDVRLVEGLAERFELTVLARRVEGGFEV